MAVRLLVNAVVTGQRQVDTLQNSVGRLSRQARLLQTALVGAFAIAGANALTRSITEASDAVTNIQNQLRAAGVAAGDLANAQADVFRLADGTRSSLEATGGLYARVLRSTRELGISQEQGLTITRAFQQTLALSGAEVSEAAAASLQFGQALASGRLQGDELRSILENNSFFAQRFAAELGVGVGQLREMGAQGQLTSELLADIALRIAPDVNNSFEQLTPTFGQAANVLRSRLTLATAELGTAIRGVLGDVVQLARSFGDQLAGGIRRFANILNILRENAEGVRVVFVALAGAITTLLIPSIVALANAILVRLAGALLFIIGPIGTLVVSLAAIGAVAAVAFGELRTAAGTVVDRLVILGEQIGLFFEALPDEARVAGAGFVEGFVENLDDIGEAIINTLVTPINGVLAFFDRELINIDIPNISLDIDTTEAEARLEDVDNRFEELNMRAADSSMEVQAAFGAVIDRVVEAAGEAGDAVRALLEGFSAELPAIVTPEMMGGDGGMDPNEMVMNALLEGVEEFDATTIGARFEQNLQSGIEQALNEGDLDSIGQVVLSSFTMSINETLANNLSTVIGNVFEGITMNAEGFGAGLVDTFSGIFDAISGLFSGGGGGIGGLLGGIGGLFGFQNGGIIPGPQGPGPDNRIVAARSGELILNRAQQDNLANQLQSQGMTVNQTIQVTGNVDEATRRAVREMGNEITNNVQQRFNERGLLR